jgi:hypothetical protein
MSAIPSQSGFTLTYYPSLFAVVRDNLTEALSWSDQDTLHLAEKFMARVPGFESVNLMRKQACGKVDVDIDVAIPASLSKPLGTIYAELETLAVQAVRAADNWLVQVKTYMPALIERLQQLEERNYYEYDYVIYRSLVHQEAAVLLQKSGLLDIRSYSENDPLAVTLLVQFWEAAVSKKAVDYDELLTD